MYLKQMIGFLVKASCDHRVGPHHIALYIAIFQQWCMNNGENPVSITQAGLREVSKIGKTAYYKCMRELEQYGYIKYIRSYSPVLGSLVYLEEFT
ncbi:MAG TPA: hypothetical protein PK191_08530 [Niabella sp.]|mgnify:FL=1|nr:hypothetical protein [Niabella sp.]HQX74431.1 hypothetical protein [Chitinophagaceae bacterium]HQW16458.1 hypothetical protein [Niabella sp.]HQX21705.1 hypothetical protein [Niabella sp.]HRB08112.1 hypothetical protein [Niabella sp.]